MSLCASLMQEPQKQVILNMLSLHKNKVAISYQEYDWTFSLLSNKSDNDSLSGSGSSLQLVNLPKPVLLPAFASFSYNDSPVGFEEPSSTQPPSVTTQSTPLLPEQYPVTTPVPNVFNKEDMFQSRPPPLRGSSTFPPHPLQD